MGDKQNVFIAAKAGVVLVCTQFSAAFGWIGWLCVAWIICMALDWLSGTAAAKATGTWASSVARDGIWHKCGMMIVVLVCAVLDMVLSQVIGKLPGVLGGFDYGVAVLPVVLVWYIFTEMGSIAENANKMGANVPSFLISLFTAGRLGTENVWDTILKKATNNAKDNKKE